MTSENRPRWIVGSRGDEVTIGDHVALDINPGSIGVIKGVSAHGLPEVTITEGSGAGSTRAMFPGQILMKVHR